MLAAERVLSVAILRKLIQHGSKLEFSTLSGDASHCVTHTSASRGSMSVARQLRMPRDSRATEESEKCTLCNVEIENEKGSNIEPGAHDWTQTTLHVDDDCERHKRGKRGDQKLAIATDLLIRKR